VTDGALLDKQEYAIMHRKMVLTLALALALALAPALTLALALALTLPQVLHLQPMATPTEAMEAMEEDWEKDTGGEQVEV
jgi:hypothetical protein